MHISIWLVVNIDILEQLLYARLILCLKLGQILALFPQYLIGYPWLRPSMQGRKLQTEAPQPKPIMPCSSSLDHRQPVATKAAVAT
jgi:hypothetical protein